MFKQKYLLIGITCILALLNVYLIMNVAERQRKINILNWRIQDSTYNADHKLKIENYKLLNGLKSPTLLIFFSPFGCSDCIQHEVDDVKKYFDTLGKNSKIYFVGMKDDPQLKFYNKRIPIETIDINRSLFKGYLKVDNPVALLVDTKGNVYDIHKARVGKPEVSDNFYKKMNTFFKEINS